MLSFKYLYDYFIYNDEISEVIDETFLYDKTGKKFICSCEKNSWLKKLIIKFFIKTGRYITIPRVSYTNLHIQFVMELKNQRLIDYMNLFGTEHKFDGAYKIIYCQEEKIFVSDGGDFEYFTFEKIRSVVESWSEKNAIKVNFDYIKPKGYVFDNPDEISAMRIPTDGIKLSFLFANVTMNNMFFDMKTYSIVDSEDAGTFPYDHCIKMPYYNEEKIYDYFLSEMNLENVKEELHNDEDFGVAFRKYIDYNHILFEKYCTYETEFLKPIIISWCKENNVKYIV